MSKNFTLRFVFAFVLSIAFFFADAQIAAWDLTGQGSGTAGVATAAATVFNSNLDASNLLTRGAGAAASAGANSFRTVGFKNDGISTANTDYFQFTLSATPGYKLSLSTIDARFAGTATYFAAPGVTSQFAYSLDGTNFMLIGSATTSTSTTLSTVSLSSIAALQNVPDNVTVTFRYYASGQTATGGWGFNSSAAGVYGLAIGGTIASNAVPSDAPTTTSSNLSFGNYTTSSIQFQSWTKGDGAGRIVIVRPATGSGVPQNGNAYTANSNSFSDVANSKIGSGVVVYNGSGNGPLTVTGLAAGTQYAFDVYEYNGTGGTISYGNIATASHYTLQTEPVAHSSIFNAGNTTSSSVTLNFSATNATTGYIILQAAGTVAPTATPVDGTAYTVGSTLGTGTVAAIISSASVSTAAISNLLSSSSYSFSVIPFGKNTGTADAQTFNYYSNGTIPSVTVTTSSDYVSLTALNVPVIENFNGMGNSAVTALPQGFKIGADYTSGTTTTTQAAGNTGTGALSSSSSGGAYNFADGVTATSTDRSLGFLTSGSYSSNRSVIFKIVNKTGATITDLDINYDIEKYRTGTNTVTWSFFHGSSSTATTEAADGKEIFDADAENGLPVTPASVTNKSVSLTGLSIPDGGEYYLRWNHNGTASSSQALGLDNVSVVAVTDRPCKTPASLAMNLTFSSVTDSSVAVSFTAANPAVNEYLVIASENSELTSDPADQQDYQLGDNVGDGSVVYKGSLTNFTASGLSDATHYYFFVYSVNNKCVGGPKYSLQSLSADVTTPVKLPPCVLPSQQPTALNFSSVSTKTIQGSFIASGADEYLIVRTNGSALNALPLNGKKYNSGELIGNGTVIQQAASTSFSASGLTPETSYNFYVFSVNSQACANGPLYNTADALTAAQATLPLPVCATPTAQPTNLGFNVSNSAVSGTFNSAGSDLSYLVVISNSPNLNATPADGTDYAAGNTIGNGTVVALNDATSFTANNLNASTQYYVFVFAANKNCTGGTKYLTTAPLTASVTTSNTPKNNIYFGNLHAHSDYSDGNQDHPGYKPTDDWQYAATAQGLDFLGISEHNHYSSPNNPGNLLSLYHSGIEEAKAFNATHPNFLALYGMEWGVISGGGHVVVYGDDMKELFGWESNVGGVSGPNYDVFVPKSTYTGSTGLFKNINDFASKNAFATLAHPNNTDYNNLSNINYDVVADNAIVGTAVESGPSGSTNTTYSNPGSPMSYLWYFQKLLSKGYHLGPVIDHDNHKTTFGKTTPARTAVLAPELTQSAIVKAVRDMHFYATEDIDAKVDFTVNSRIMGSVFTDRNAPAISVTLSDATNNTNNAIIRIMHGIPGSGVTAVQIDSVIGNSLSFVHTDLATNTTGYYYADITNGSSRIITSPIWYTRVCELTTTLNEKACGSYNWNGETFTASGTYSKQFRTAGGCDSIVTLNLIINQPATGDTTAVACDSFTWYGQTFTASTTATHLFTNAAGCDSTVTLHLTINNSPKVTIAANGATIICPASAVTLTATADQTVTYQWSLNGNALSNSNDSYAATVSGNYNVTATTAANCSAASNTITVIVQDITAPVPDVAALPTITGKCSATVTAPTATDNCKGKITATTNDATSFTQQGTYTIHWVYNDGNGNTSLQEQTVVVKDVTAPVPDVAALPTITSECSVSVSAPTATDNCKGKITATTNDATSFKQQGTYTIHWMYNDGNGNTSSQEQTVVIKDVTNPVITCAAPQSFCYNASNNYSVPVLIANDNCHIASVTYTISGATTRSGNGTNASGTFNVGVSTISWTVTDDAANSTVCSVTVTVNSPLTVTIPDVYAVTPGGDANTLYKGYGPLSLTLTANAIGGTSPYTYNWSNGVQSATNVVNVSAGTTTYSVVVKDAKGCGSSSVQKTIYVVDVRSGNNGDKVFICHKGQTLSIASSAVEAHLAHGDKIGACAITTAMRNEARVIAPINELKETSATVTISPVPNNGIFSVHLNKWDAGAAVINIYDGNGRIVASRKAIITGKGDKVDFNLPQLAQGMYNVNVVSGKRNETVRISVNR